MGNSLHLESHGKDKKTIQEGGNNIVIPGQGSTNNNGTLDQKHKLIQVYANLWKDPGFEETWRKEFFQQVRILVIGRSGAGKTTLIRLMVGKEGPQTIADQGVAGVQDIHKEFLYSSEDEGVPLLIHDSNGMDIKGKERVDEIKLFLKKHQNRDDFTKRVHIIWYVVSAMDPRCVEDGDVMKMISNFKIPLLLILTNNDYERPKVTDTSLNKLLEGYGSQKEREGVKRLMVKVSNQGVTTGDNNELKIDETMRDTKGLKLVAKRTQYLIDKRLRYTWVAAQAVDMEGKFDVSAGLIAGYARRAFLTSLPRLIPVADLLSISIIFYRVFVTLCQIWVVPQTLREAMKDTLVISEGATCIGQKIAEEAVYVAGLAGTLAATVATGGIALPSVIFVIFAELGTKLEVPVVVRTFSLQVLATILYVKSTQKVCSKDRWDTAYSKEDYVRLCDEFSNNAEYQSVLRLFAKDDHSTRLDVALRKDKVKAIMKRKILKIYSDLLLNRPNSLHTLFHQKDDVDVTSTSTSGDHSHNVSSLFINLDLNEEKDEDKGYDELDTLCKGSQVT